MQFSLNFEPKIGDKIGNNSKKANKTKIANKPKKSSNTKQTNEPIKSNNTKKAKGLKVAFLILAHKNPSQIVTFIDALDCEQTAFFIHIDKKSNIMGDSSLEKLKNRKNVFFTKQRKNVSWGGYGHIDATLLLLKECLEKDKYDYISLHSGQDLPIKNKYEIIDFFKKNQGKEFIEFFSLKIKTWWPDNPIDRIKYYWFIEEIGLEKSWELYEAQKELCTERKYFEDIQPYAGWQWWTITRDCAQYIIDYVSKNPSFCDYYKYTLIPDEGFFQTIILNSHFKEKVLCYNLTYWEGAPGQLHPKVFTEDDYNKLVTSDRFFARKFDVDVDEKIIKMIINKII